MGNTLFICKLSVNLNINTDVTTFIDDINRLSWDDLMLGSVLSNQISLKQGKLIVHFQIRIHETVSQDDLDHLINFLFSIFPDILSIGANLSHIYPYLIKYPGIHIIKTRDWYNQENKRFREAYEYSDEEYDYSDEEYDYSDED
jgi:hypothetical protein